MDYLIHPTLVWQELLSWDKPGDGGGGLQMLQVVTTELNFEDCQLKSV